MLANGPRNSLTAGDKYKHLTEFVVNVDREVIDAVLGMVNPVAALPKLAKDEIVAEARKVMKEGKNKAKAANKKMAEAEKKDNKGASRRGVVRRVLE